MARRDLPGALRRVGHDPAFLIHVAEAAEREALGRDVRGALPLRVDRAEEEHAIRHDRTAGLDAAVAHAGLGHVDGAIHGRDLVVRALEGLRTEVPEHAASQRVRSALRDDVDDAARGLAELRFVSARLHLCLLDEVERHAVAERTEDDRVGAERAVAGVGDVDAVDDVLILEAAAAGHRWVGVSDLAAAADAGREVQRVAETPADRDPLQHVAVEHRAGCRRRRVDDGGGARDVDRFASAAPT